MAFVLSNRCIAQESPSYFLHTVETGQTLYSISNMYNVTVAQIVELNPNSDKAIYTGQVLRIPQKSKSSDYFFHTIAGGETLYHLSVQYKVSAKEICDLNPGLTADNFQSGTVIRIPKNTTEVITTVPVTKESVTTTVPKCRDTHKIKKKETIYSITKKYKITEEELLAANPKLKENGLQKGDVICIPYHSDKPAFVPPSNQELFNSSRIAAKKAGPVKLAVLLPFKDDSRMVEYYEGLLIAVDSLKRTGVSMDIYAYDTSIGVEKTIATHNELQDVDVIIGPRDKKDIQTLANYAKQHKERLVIPFTSKDNEVFNNPYIYQINTQQIYLYNTVYEHFLKQFNHPYVIFLKCGQDDNTKEKYIEGFKNVLVKKGIPHTELSINSTNKELSEALFSDRENVFIPTSGTHVSLIKVLTKLELLIKSNYKRISLFGYPEWQTMTKDHLKQMFLANTYFYTTFYTNDILPEAKKFEKKYTNWYHKLMENRYPKYGMLGYDTGFFFLKGLSQYGPTFDLNINKMNVYPVQTGIHLQRINNWSGFMNNKVFFVRYTPQSDIIKLDFD